MGVGADVEVLGPAAEQQVAHAAPHQVGEEPVVLQPVHDLQRVGVDVLAGHVVLGAGQDAWRHLVRRIVLEKRHYTRVGSATSGRPRLPRLGARPVRRAHDRHPRLLRLGAPGGPRAPVLRVDAAHRRLPGGRLPLHLRARAGPGRGGDAPPGRRRRRRPPRRAAPAGWRSSATRSSFRLWMFASGRFRAPRRPAAGGHPQLHRRVAPARRRARPPLAASRRTARWPRCALAAAIAAVTPLTWDSALAQRLPGRPRRILRRPAPGLVLPARSRGRASPRWARRRACSSPPGGRAAARRGCSPPWACSARPLIPLALVGRPHARRRSTRATTSGTRARRTSRSRPASCSSPWPPRSCFDKLPGQGPIRQLGRTSLLVYWVHLEIVYGDYVARCGAGQRSPSPRPRRRCWP